MSFLKTWLRRREFRRRIESAARSEAPAVLIYQMGKVASSTIHASLEAAGVEVFRVHVLDPKSVATACEQCRQTGRPVLKQLEHSAAVYEKLVLPRHPLKVITLVREPVGRNVSAYFQNLEEFWPGENPHERVPMDELIRGFLEKFPHHAPLTWFDREFHKFLGIDVFAHPFPQDTGMGRISAPPHEVLILRVEMDDAVKGEALAKFLGLERLAFVQKNVSSGKSYADAYRRFKTALRLPASYVDEMLGSKYARHFYSDAERARLREQWLKLERPTGAAALEHAGLPPGSNGV